MASTKYTVFADGVETDFTRGKKDAAIAEADRMISTKEATTVEVRTNAGTVVHENKRRATGKRTKPGTRTVELSDELALLVPDGYVPAYARLRNTAIVLRSELAEAESRYLVIDTVNGEQVGFAETTREAGQLMKQLGAQVRAAKARATVIPTPVETPVQAVDAPAEDETATVVEVVAEVPTEEDLAIV